MRLNQKGGESLQQIQNEPCLRDNGHKLRSTVSGGGLTSGRDYDKSKPQHTPDLHGSGVLVDTSRASCLSIKAASWVLFIRPVGGKLPVFEHISVGCRVYRTGWNLAVVVTFILAICSLFL